MRLGALTVAASLVAAMSIESPACEVPGGVKFPLQVEPGKHYPTDSKGAAFFMHGDTAWSLIADLREEEAFLYLEDRKARGFNTILVNLIEYRFARNAPANAYGETPFVDNEDFAVPNETYFAHADRILQKACELEFLVLLVPAYLGYGGGDHGWYQKMVAAGAEKLDAYGRFVARRYRHLDNIMWVHGGDYDPADRGVVRTLAYAIMEEDPDALATAHGAPETAPVEFWGHEPWLTVNNIYTYGPVYAAALREYRIDRGMPFFLMESAYEFEFEADEHRIRIQAYQAILSGAFGHLYGNNPIWHFGGPGLHRHTMEWKDALDSPGARSMEVLTGLVSSTEWWLLEPDSRNTFLLDGIGMDMGRAVAATSSDGSHAIVYLPYNEVFTVDLARLSSTSVYARWRDPTSGATLVAGGSPFTAERTRFEPPGNNSRGFPDWILELSTQAPEQNQ